MSVETFRAEPPRSSAIRQLLERAKADPAYQAFLTLRVGFTALPIVMGVDKFFNNFVNWERYLGHWIWNISPFSAVNTMHVVGVIEIVAGVLVALKPRMRRTLSPRGSRASSSTFSPIPATTTSRCVTSACCSAP